jgi:hypothetical protein
MVSLPAAMRFITVSLKNLLDSPKPPPMSPFSSCMIYAVNKSNSPSSSNWVLLHRLNSSRFDEMQWYKNPSKVSQAFLSFFSCPSCSHLCNFQHHFGRMCRYKVASSISSKAFAYVRFGKSTKRELLDQSLKPLSNYYQTRSV